MHAFYRNIPCCFDLVTQIAVLRTHIESTTKSIAKYSQEVILLFSLDNSPKLTSVFSNAFRYNIPFFPTYTHKMSPVGFQ